MTETTPAPAAVPSAPAAEQPSNPVGVDLSDLQAEQDAANAKAAEDDVFDNINKSTEKPEESSDDDEDAAADDETDDGSEDGETEAPKRRTRQDRYRDQLSRERERTASLEHELATLRSRSGGGLTPEEISERVSNAIGAQPQEKDFDNYLDYDRAVTSWQVRKDMVVDSLRAAHKKGQAERTQRMSELVEDHQKRVEDFRQRNGEISAQEWDAVMKTAEKLHIEPHLQEMVLESGKSAQLQFFLAKNPQRLDKLNRMSERAAAREIGQIEARLSMPQPRTKTAAPPPSRAPRGGAAPASQEAELDSWLTKKYGSR